MKKDLMIPLLGRDVQLRAETYNAEARTVEIVWTTGATVRRRRFWEEDIDEELIVDPAAIRLDRLNSGAPFLNTHNAYELEAVLGVVVDGSARLENGQGIATIRFSDREDVEPILRDIANGIIRNVSVGYRVHKYEIEKRDGQVELWRAVDWEPLEISAVPIGADPGAHIRKDDALHPCVLVRETSATNAAQRAVSTMKGKPMAKKQTPAAGEDGGNETETRQAAQPVPATEAAPAAPAQDAQRAAADAVRAERERIGAINALAGRFKMERSFVDKLITDGISVDAARTAILDQLAEREERGIGHTHISNPAGGLDATVTRREALVEAILHRAQPGMFQLTDRAREYRGLTLLDLARDCLEAAGGRTRGMTAGEIAHVATRGSLPAGIDPLQIRGAGLHSTSDFPLILAAVAGKRLRGAYASTPRTFTRWARGVTATDFKPMYPTQIGNFPALQAVKEGAEFSYGTISEGRESYQLATYGRIVALTRQAIINDDLRAFDRAVGTAGQRAADLESAIVYNVLIANAALSDTVALFHTDHGNLASSGTVIDEEALAAMIEAMAQQTDLDGEEYIANRPRFLLVPPGQRSVEARKQVAATTPNSTQDVNAFAGSFEVIEEPRLFKAGGPQPWFAAADPNLVDTVEYAHLEGQMEPFMDQRAGFEVDGVEFKVRHDFAAKALDYRGLYKNAGANPAS